MNASCDSIDNRMVEFVKKIDEFIDYETELLDLYKKKHEALIPNNKKEFIEELRNLITEHTKTYSFLIDLKTDNELVGHCAKGLSRQAEPCDSQSIIVRHKKSESKNYNYPHILIHILEGKPISHLIKITMADNLKNIPSCFAHCPDFIPIKEKFQQKFFDQTENPSGKELFLFMCRNSEWLQICMSPPLYLSQTKKNKKNKKNKKKDCNSEENKEEN
jgi:hypothetical protein